MAIHIVTRSSFKVKDVDVLPLEGIVRSASGSKRLEPVTMNVLLTLVKRAGEVVTRDEILDAVWKNQDISDESITRCISELRAAFGDQARNPTYIETVPKRGYRLIAPVAGRQAGKAPSIPEPRSFGIGWLSTPRVLAALVVFGMAAALVGATLQMKPTTLDANRVIVLPTYHVAALFDEQFISGISESVREELVDAKFQVSSRQTADALRDTSSLELAEQLGARWIVESVCREVDGKAQITYSLIDGKSQFVEVNLRVFASPESSGTTRAPAQAFLEEFRRHLEAG